MSHRQSLVLVTRKGSFGGHDVPDFQVLEDLHHGQNVVDRSLRRRDSIMMVLGLDTREVSGLRIDVLLLPQPPESVDLGVMKEKQRV
jgi:hypothetical protein